MNELEELIGSVINAINNMTELFYQHKNKEALEYMDFILDGLTVISNQIADGEGVQNEVNILGILVEALSAFENRDYILLSDILSYDMVDELKKII